MNGKIIAGIVVLVVGVVLVAVLCGLGGYAKQTIHDTVLTRLEYELPKGYEKDPNFEQCYRSTVTSFDEEYYLWNLTNKDEVINGGRPHFNLVGPFPYTEWYCEYDHKVNDTHLTYRRYSEGYRFIRKDPGPNDDVLITNFNPAYLVLLQSLGGQDSILSSALVGPALKSIISTFNANVGRVWINAVPQVLSQVNSVISIGYAANFFTTIFSVSAETFFTAGYSSSIGGLQGWTSYANQNFPSVDTTLTNASRDAIYGAWTNVALYQVFALSSVQDIVGNYSVTAGQAGVLKAYSAQYLPSSTTVQSNVAGQWANGDSASLLTGWEIGIPTRTDIATADVFQLFSQTGTCSLVNTTTFTASWVPALTAQNPALATCDGLSLTVTQKARILAYISSFSTAVVSVQLKKLWQLADWSDFGHAQWGHLVAGQSLGPSAGLTYIPEIAGQSVANSSCVTYTTADAQALTSGPYSLYNSTNIGIFSTLLASSNLATIKALWPVLTDTKISCLASYLNTIVLGQAVSSALATAKAAGGDYITTRTARQWLFDATDPLLVLLQQNTTTVPLVTQNSTLVQSKANATLTYVSVYTGKNDLYDALMPLNNGASMAGWCGDVRVTGFNGSQFLPYGYLDKPEEFTEHPLNLYHRLVSRPIPFENKGNDEWNGVKVRYLSLRADALTSGSINAANSVYCAQYSGAINKTGISPNLPLFLTTPNFLSADKEFYENIDFTDSIYADTYDGDTNPLSRHRLSLFILAEPTLGSSVWGNLPIQANFKFGPSALYPNIKSAYAPIFWNAIGDIATENDLDDIKTSLYANQRAWKVLIGVGVGAGVAFMVAGIVLIHHFKKHENELKEIPMGSSSG